jgi:hypothetical protein
VNYLLCGVILCETQKIKLTEMQRTSFLIWVEEKVLDKNVEYFTA